MREYDLCTVRIKLEDGVVYKFEMSFEDYISFMRDLKTKAFITIWKTTFNKMHILTVESDLSPHISMGVSDFIHAQKEKVNGGYDWREIAYNKWCDTISFNNNKENDN